MSAVELLDKAIALVDDLLARASVNEPAAPPSAAPVEEAAPAVKVKPAVEEVKPVAAAAEDATGETKKEKNGKKEKKEKKEKPAAAPAEPAVAAGTPEAAFSKALIKVAYVIEAGDVENSDKLYKTKLDCGNGEIRQVLTGLRKLVPRDQLQGHHVCVILNLKTAKLAGEVSEGMILSADQALPDGGEYVRTIIPPVGSEAGDQVFLAGGAPSQTTVKTLKSDDWKKVAAGLRVGATSNACFFEHQLVTAKGNVNVPEGFAEGSGIH